MLVADIRFEAVGEEHFEALLAVRIAAMRPSLERLGRFDPERARQRFRSGFEPQALRRIVVDGELAGCVALKDEGEAWRIDQFYLLPSAQGRRLGSRVMQQLLAEAVGKPIRVSVLLHSDAIRFYERHGFALEHAGEFDLDYVRPA